MFVEDIVNNQGLTNHLYVTFFLLKNVVQHFELFSLCTILYNKTF